MGEGLSDRVEEEVKVIVIPDEMVLEFEETSEEPIFVRGVFVSRPRFQSRKILSAKDIGGLSKDELRLLYIGRKRINFRGSWYVSEPSEAYINSEGKLISRFRYDKRDDNPSEF